MDCNDTEVRYDLYCKNCIHEKRKVGQPCEECLETPVRDSTVIPLHFEIDRAKVQHSRKNSASK